MNILAIGAHHDDVELGAGGTLAKLVENDNQVFALTLTNSETHYDIKGIHRLAKIAVTEANEAAKILGLSIVVPPAELIQNVGELSYNTSYMRWIEDLLIEKAIDTVFCHWAYDLNTDHIAASQISITASRHIHKVLMYRSNWYQPKQPFNPCVFSDISTTIDKKRKALLAFESEVNNRGLNWINSFIDYNRTAGFTIGTEYAETFEFVRYTI
ncbi:MAG: hypothetical protein CL896_00535 [Dehalococcoidia bacterium]|nr:hypothetical protein [Dehalococcoidia bacterium]|tara:strand:+ start:12312 stop:12950 length:639 start_codon:yes stop_codon:yes gene_type:complete